jgi:hypothetical protein
MTIGLVARLNLASVTLMLVWLLWQLLHHAAKVQSGFTITACVRASAAGAGSGSERSDPP